MTSKLVIKNLHSVSADKDYMLCPDENKDGPVCSILSLNFDLKFLT